MTAARVNVGLARRYVALLDRVLEYDGAVMPMRAARLIEHAAVAIRHSALTFLGGEGEATFATLEDDHDRWRLAVGHADVIVASRPSEAHHPVRTHVRGTRVALARVAMVK